MWAGVRDAVTILVGGNVGEVLFTIIGTAFGAGRAPVEPMSEPATTVGPEPAGQASHAVRRAAQQRPVDQGHQRAQ